MSSSMRRTMVITSLLLFVGCAGNGAPTTTEEIVVEEVINVDSLLDVIDVRYNQLCDQRKAAYSEHDAELRRELLERNDAACKALDDSLRRVISIRDREITQ